MAKNREEYVYSLIDEISPALKKIQKSTKSMEAQLSSTATRSKSSFQGMASSAVLLKGAAIGVAAIATSKVVTAFYKAGVQTERLTTQFTTLLGSTENAQKRMKTLTDFAAKTPFQLEGVANASRILQTLTNGTLATGDGLRLVGDAAASTGADFTNLAMHVGRAYSGLQANRPVGESMMRLQELGLVSGETRNRIEELQKQSRGKEAWEVLQTELKKSEGGMKALSETVEGRMSTIRDQLTLGIQRLLESSGAWDALNKALGWASNAFQKLADSGWIEKIGALLGGYGSIIKNFVVFTFDILKAVGVWDALGKTIGWAGDMFKKLADSGWLEKIRALLGGIGAIIKTNVVASFNVLKTVAFGVTSAIMKYLATLSKALDKVVKVIPQKLRPEWTNTFGEVGANFDRLANGMADTAADSGKKVIASVQEQVSNYKNLWQTLSIGAESFKKSNVAGTPTVSPTVSPTGTGGTPVATTAGAGSVAVVESAGVGVGSGIEQFIAAQTEKAEAAYNADMIFQELNEKEKARQQEIVEANRNRILMIAEAEQSWAEQQEQIRQENQRRAVNVAVSGAQTIGNAIFSIAKRSADREKKQQIDKVNASGKSEKQKQKMIEAIEREAFEKNKKRSIGQALMNAGLGATKTIANVGFPAAIPLLILQGIMTATNIATIASQKFAKGLEAGPVKKQAGVPPTGDQHLVGVNPGEYVATPQQLQNLSGNNVTVGDTVLNVSGPVTEEGINQISTTLEDHREKLKNELLELTEAGLVGGLTF